MNTELHTAPLPTHHLTEAEFGEIISGCGRTGDFALTQGEEHLLTCEQCASELAILRESLELFREASTAYADAELRQIPPVKLPPRRVVMFPLRPVYLAAAAALLLAAFLPMQMLRQRTRQTEQKTDTANATTSFQHYATESNEALLEDVDQAASASVPDAMQALADPTAGNDLSVRKSNQRKD